MEDIYQDTSNRRSRAEKIEVEVLLKKKCDHWFTIQTSEDSRPFDIPTHGVKVLKRVGEYATLRLSERKAINYNLV